MTRILMVLSAFILGMGFVVSPAMAEETPVVEAEYNVETVDTTATEEMAPELVCPEEVAEGEEMSEECKEKMKMDAEKAAEDHADEVMDSEASE